MPQKLHVPHPHYASTGQVYAVRVCSWEKGRFILVEGATAKDAAAFLSPDDGAVIEVYELTKLTAYEVNMVPSLKEL